MIEWKFTFQFSPSAMLHSGTAQQHYSTTWPHQPIIDSTSTTSTPLALTVAWPFSSVPHQKIRINGLTPSHNKIFCTLQRSHQLLSFITVVLSFPLYALTRTVAKPRAMCSRRPKALRGQLIWTTLRWWVTISTNYKHPIPILFLYTPSRATARSNARN